MIAVDGVPGAVLDFADPPRSDGARALADLRACGVTRIVLATGDRRAVAERVVAGLPVDAVAADLDPSGKTAIVAAERANGPVMMVGDGVNDAPALAAADLGVALGARGRRQPPRRRMSSCWSTVSARCRRPCGSPSAHAASRSRARWPVSACR
ncbi:HAD-IC family P-type ATPase [Methylobacterium oryzae CBMB20]